MIEPQEGQRCRGRAVWLGDITRQSLQDGSLRGWIDSGKVIGAALSARSMEAAIAGTEVYDEAIRAGLKRGLYGEPLINELIGEDAARAADLFGVLHHRTRGLDGWVALLLNPLLKDHPDRLIESMIAARTRILPSNVLVTLSAAACGAVIEAAVCHGISCIIGDICSLSQCLHVVDSCRRGFERCCFGDRKPAAAVFLAVPVGRLAALLADDAAPQRGAPQATNIFLEIATGLHRAHASVQWRRLFRAGVRAPRLISIGGAEGAGAGASHRPGGPDHVLMLETGRLEDRGCEPGPPFGADGNDTLVLQNAIEADDDAVADRLQQEMIAGWTRDWIALLEATAQASARLAGRAMGDGSPTAAAGGPVLPVPG